MAIEPFLIKFKLGTKCTSSTRLWDATKVGRDCDERCGTYSNDTLRRTLFLVNAKQCTVVGIEMMNCCQSKVLAIPTPFNGRGNSNKIN